MQHENLTQRHQSNQLEFSGISLPTGYRANNGTAIADRNYGGVDLVKDFAELTGPSPYGLVEGRFLIRGH